MCVSVCVCMTRSLKFHARPPPQGWPSQGGEQSLCGVPRVSAPNPLSNGWCANRLVAAAGSHHHVAVLLEDDVGAVVEVEHRDGVELRGGAAGFGNRVRVDEVNLEGGVPHVRQLMRIRPAPRSRLPTRVCTMAWLVAFM